MCFKVSYTFILLAIKLVIVICTDEFSSNARPSNRSDFFWHPHQEGGFVPALLEGGPAIVDKDIEEVTFIYYHTKNQQSGKNIFIGDRPSLNEAGYNSKSDLILICHGFTSSALAGPAPIIRKEIMAANISTNIVAIDWSKLAAAPNYARAAGATKLVGMKICNLIKFLVKEGLLETQNAHFIGHSLGAHVGGFLGKCIVKDLRLKKIGRITALDAACPLFCGRNKNERLASADASFIDAIHTNGGIVAYKDPIGDADFYPNGGITQPGCSRFTESASACHHTRSYELYAESIGRPQSFLSRLCSNWDEYTRGHCTRNEFTNMGHGTPSQVRGTYYLKTKSESPYSE
ncbi:unnamed protein product [Allacma fusca]|uniref:Lipase domain-containing protein n=1 Tax=Allacma fusca TaxID=39272 RepID=A0A8J2P2V4_9HEXA|nr:unnamed protein product [Allacma fusca]